MRRYTISILILLAAFQIGCGGGAGTPRSQPTSALAIPTATPVASTPSPAITATTAVLVAATSDSTGPLVLEPTPDRSVPPTPTPPPAPPEQTATAIAYASAPPAPPPGTPAPTGTPGGIPAGSIVLSGSVTLSGEESASKVFKADAPGDMFEQPFASCEQYAQGVVAGDRRSFWVPDPSSGWEPVIYDAISVLMRVSPYQGPGVYDLTTGVSAWTQEEIDAFFARGVGYMLIPSVARNTGYAALAPESAIEVTVQPDGSGRLRFSGLSVIDDPARSIAGEMVWNCSVQGTP